jgi:hypothetical protein
MKCKLFILISFILVACNGNVKVSENTNTAQTTIPPAIPTSKLVEVFESCDYIDFIFSSLPFSISQSERVSIQQTITYIDPKQPPKIDPSCPYFAQQIFQSDGEIILDAKIFFQEGCTYYLFYEDGVAIYSGSFTNDGIKFYNNIIQQAQQVGGNG